MDFLKITAAILAAVIFISSLSVMEKPVMTMITVVTSLTVIFLIINTASDSINQIMNILDDFSGDNFKLLLKTVGICAVTQFVSDIALDCGNRTLSNQMIFIGKLSILFLSLPVFIQVLEIIGNIAG